MLNEKYKTAMALARKRVCGMDAIDQKAGFAAPGDGNRKDRVLDLAETAQFALMAAIQGDSWDCAAEAAVYLERATGRVL